MADVVEMYIPSYFESEVKKKALKTIEYTAGEWGLIRFCLALQDSSKAFWFVFRLIDGSWYCLCNPLIMYQEFQDLDKITGHDLFWEFRKLSS